MSRSKGFWRRIRNERQMGGVKSGELGKYAPTTFRSYVDLSNSGGFCLESNLLSSSCYDLSVEGELNRRKTIMSCEETNILRKNINCDKEPGNIIKESSGVSVKTGDKLLCRLCGYLNKMKLGSRSLGSAFKRRWFVMADETCTLLYYSTSTDQIPLGKIDISRAVFTFDLNGESNSANIFEVRTPEKAVLLQADDNQTMLYWIQNLQKKRKKYFLLRDLNSIAGDEDTLLVNSSEFESPVAKRVDRPVRTVGESAATSGGISRSRSFRDISLSKLGVELQNKFIKLRAIANPSNANHPVDAGTGASGATKMAGEPVPPQPPGKFGGAKGLGSTGNLAEVGINHAKGTKMLGAIREKLSRQDNSTNFVGKILQKHFRSGSSDGCAECLKLQAAVDGLMNDNNMLTDELTAAQVTCKNLCKEVEKISRQHGIWGTVSRDDRCHKKCVDQISARDDRIVDMDEFILTIQSELAVKNEQNRSLSTKLQETAEEVQVLRDNLKMKDDMLNFLSDRCAQLSSDIRPSDEDDDFAIPSVKKLREGTTEKIATTSEEVEARKLSDGGAGEVTQAAPKEDSNDSSSSDSSYSHRVVPAAPYSSRDGPKSPVPSVDAMNGLYGENDEVVNANHLLEPKESQESGSWVIFDEGMIAAEQRSFERSEDEKTAYKTQNQMLNQEILDLNELLRLSEQRLDKSQIRITHLEALCYQLQSRHLRCLNEVHSLCSGDDASDAVKNMRISIEKAMEMDPSSPNFPSHHGILPIADPAYDQYGFEKHQEHGDLTAIVNGLQMRSEQIKNRKSQPDLTLSQKWDVTLIGIERGMSSRSRELKFMIRDGVPNQFRSRLWKICIDFLLQDYRANSVVKSYSGLLDMVNSKALVMPAANQIELDLLRTLPNNKHFLSLSSQKITSLRNVLLAFSIHNPDVGYCQGLNRLAAILLLFLNEEEAFWGMVGIVEVIMPPKYYTHTLIAAHADQRVLKDIVTEKLPLLVNHFASLSFDLSLFTFSWFLTVFVDNMPANSFLRVWDTFLYEGSKVLFRYTVAILKYFEERMLTFTSSADMNLFARNMCEDIVDIDHLSLIAFNELNPFSMRKVKNKRHFHLQKLNQELQELEKLRHSFENSFSSPTHKPLQAKKSSASNVSSDDCD